MVAKPSVIPVIDSTDSNRTAPSAGVQSTGYVLNAILASAEYNHTQGYTGDWLTYIDERIDDGATADVTVLHSRLSASDEGLRLSSTGAQFSIDGAATVLDMIREGAAVIDTNPVSEYNAIASDGTGDVTGFSMDVGVEDTVSLGVIPMGAVWSTMNAAGSFAERMHLTSEGVLTMGAPAAVFGTGIHIFDSASSGATPDGASDNLVIESLSNHGITFMGGGGSQGALTWGDPADANVGQIAYSHATDQMFFVSNAAIAMILDTRRLGLGTGTFPDLGNAAGSMHIKISDSAGTVNAVRDMLVLEAGASNIGLTFLTANTQNAGLAWADPEDDNVGQIVYTHTSNQMTFTTNAAPGVVFSGRRAGIGTGTFPDLGDTAGALHIKVGDSGATPAGTADNLIIESDTTGGLTIASGNLSTGHIQFADDGNPAAAFVIYNHSTDLLSIHGGGGDFILDTNRSGLGQDAANADLGNGLHIKTSDVTSATVSADADELVLEQEGNVGLTLISGTDDLGTFNFADGAATADGFIVYDHTAATRQLSFGAQATTGMVLGLNELMIGNISGAIDATLHLRHTATGPVLRFENADTTIVADQSIGLIEFEHQDATTSGVAAQIECTGFDALGEGQLIFRAGTPGSLFDVLVLDRDPSSSGRRAVVGDASIGDPTNQDAALLVKSDLNNTVASLFSDLGSASTVGLAIQIGEDTPATTTTYIQCRDGDGDSIGTIQHTFPGSAFEIVDPSDPDLKMDIENTKLDCERIVRDLSLIEFRWKKAGKNSPMSPIGFNAKNCQKVFPQMVSRVYNDPSDKTSKSCLMTSKAALIPVLTGAIQKIADKFDAMMIRLEALEARA